VKPIILTMSLNKHSECIINTAAPVTSCACPEITIGRHDSFPYLAAILNGFLCTTPRYLQI